MSSIAPTQNKRSFDDSSSSSSVVNKKQKKEELSLDSLPSSLQCAAALFLRTLSFGKMAMINRDFYKMIRSNPAVFALVKQQFELEVPVNRMHLRQREAVTIALSMPALTAINLNQISFSQGEMLIGDDVINDLVLHCKFLKRLNMGTYNNITNAGLKALADLDLTHFTAGFGFRHYREGKLISTVTDEGITHIASYKALTYFHILDGGMITPKALECLAALPLQDLGLYSFPTAVDLDFQFISSIKTLNELTLCRITRISGACFSYFTHLQNFEISGSYFIQKEHLDKILSIKTLKVLQS